MKTDRPEKKSETIKVRVPFSLKRQFLARARREGQSASDLFRDFMEDYVRQPAQRPATQTLETVMHRVRKHPRSAFAAIAGAAGLSALLTSAIPAGAAPDLRPFFETLDADGDGTVTRAEYNSAQIALRSDAMLHLGAADAGTPMLLAFGNVTLEAMPAPDARAAPGGAEGVFAAYDPDRDGAISLEEMRAAFAEAAERAFALLDKNGDGVLALGEGEGVERLDSNGDGRVSRREFSEALVISHG